MILNILFIKKYCQKNDIKYTFYKKSIGKNEIKKYQNME
jgi:hypothetical protein